MAGKTVPLPDIPGSGDELEDYIGALFQASGHFVEKAIVEQDPADLLELDIVTTDYAPADPVRRLSEVKGGGWGYTDLFKVVGWMTYLELDHGAFFVTKWDDRASAPDRMSPLGLDVVCFDDFDSAPADFESHGFGSFVEPDLIDLFRHSYGVERKLVRLILAKAKTSIGAREAKSYYRLINNGTFFANSAEESLAMLYSAYQAHPKLTLGYSLELDGGTFDPHSPPTTSTSCTNAMRHGKHPEVQACMYFEHRARLAILKAAIDYALANPSGPPSLSKSSGKKLIFHGLTYSNLPATFQSGMDWLTAQPNFRLYATFWQQFLWGWGGFYLADRTDEEFEWMSTYSGIPVDEIPIALEAFDRFFPAGGWFATPGPTDLCMVKMVPFVFQGIGAHHRREQYNLGNGIAALKPSGQYTLNDLAARINCTVDFLLADPKDL